MLPKQADDCEESDAWMKDLSFCLILMNLFLLTGHFQLINNNRICLLTLIFVLGPH